MKQPLDKTISDNPIELVHPDRASLARRLSLPGTCGTGVVAMNRTGRGGPGAQGHRTTAGRAYRQAREQDRSSGQAWSHDARAARPELRLDLLKDVGLDDGRDGDLDDLYQFVLRATVPELAMSNKSTIIERVI